MALLKGRRQMLLSGSEPPLHCQAAELAELQAAPPVSAMLTAMSPMSPMPPPCLAELQTAP